MGQVKLAGGGRTNKPINNSMVIANPSVFGYRQGVSFPFKFFLAGVMVLGRICAEAQTPPSNDNFDQRQILVGLSNIVSADNFLATSQSNEPFPISCDASHRSLWWSYTAPAAGILQINAAGVSNNVVWSVYHGNTLTQLQALAFSCSLPGTFLAQSNETFQIAVDGAFGKSGGLVLDQILFVPDLNDNFSDSVHLEGTNVTSSGNFAAATLESNEPHPNGSNTVWVSWAAPATGRAQFNLATAPQRHYWALYTGPTVNQLQMVRTIGLGNSIFAFLAVEGTVYHFQICGDGTYDYNFSLQLTPFGPCLNDNFADAELIKGAVMYIAPRSVVGATMELGEPAHMGATPQKSIWWKWQAPQHGSFYWSAAAMVTNVTLAVYRGNAVEALTLVKKATDQLSFGVTGGETYYVAGVMPQNVTDQIGGFAQYNSVSGSSRAVPGNLLREPSWEGTSIFGTLYWGMSGEIGGSVNEGGGADGTTWPVLGGGAEVWQDFSTVPGQNHAIRFAFAGGGANVLVSWDGHDVGVAQIPADEGNFWHWANFTAYASNTTSRITFHNLGPMFANVAMDSFSVVSLMDPPRIVTQPSPISIIAGGTAAMIVGVTGSAPLSYQWFFNNAPLTGQTNHILQLDGVTTTQGGNYFAIVTNAYGAATSAPPAGLIVQNPTNATILVQPYGDTIPVGGYYNLDVVAAGTPPLSYQWFFNEEAIAGATNRNVVFTNLQLTNAGIYKVRVQNWSSTVYSLPASLTVNDSSVGGGTIDFRNKFSSSEGNGDAPVFDIDGVTRLNGSNFVAQLYAGPSLELLRAAGQPTPFRTGFGAGYFVPQEVTLPNVAPGSNAVVQVRVWEAARGSSFEEARALGSKFGKSDILTVTAGGDAEPPQNLVGLQSFSLQAGLPYFVTGVITFVERQPGGIIVWSHQGQPGSRYLIEKTVQNNSWQPFVVITNITSAATFTDSANSGAAVVFYRSRILD